MRFTITLTAALVLSVALSCPLTPVLAQEDVSSGGTVTGQVVCADTERPGRFADVKLFGVPDRVAHAPEKSFRETIGGVKLTEIQTDADGRFLATNVYPGDYYVFAWMPGYLEPQTILQMAFNAGEDFSKPIPGIRVVHVAEGRTSQVNLSMERGAAISGQLVWDDGSPVTGAEISLVRANGNEKQMPERFRMVGTGMARYGPTTFGYSDDLGHFRLAGLAPGKYLVKATLQTRQQLVLHNGLQLTGIGDSSPLVVFAPEAFHRNDAKAVTLHDAEERSGVEITFRLSGMYSVSGRVISAEDGHGVNTATVRLTDAVDKEFSRWATVDDSGTFNVTFVPPGTYNLEVKRAADSGKLSTKILQNSATYTTDPPLRIYLDAKQSVIVAGGDVTGLSIALVPAKPKNLSRNWGRNHGSDRHVGLRCIGWKHVPERFDRCAVEQTGAVAERAASWATRWWATS